MAAPGTECLKHAAGATPTDLPHPRSKPNEAPGALALVHRGLHAGTTAHGLHESASDNTARAMAVWLPSPSDRADDTNAARNICEALTCDAGLARTRPP